ncbi:Pescadillo like protein [Tupaia chinensis]|uniref:Pescadillo like protein n=1 Tax=Tupaia chinensis TaxID=246437 RepID=L9KJN7_TUPCH|nr:Pescadillo like protein [Tupaia chinensis]
MNQKRRKKTMKMLVMKEKTEKDEEDEASSEKEEEARLTALEEQRMEGKKPRVMAGTVMLENKKRLAQEEESEAKCLAIMRMKKREKYLYNKIMFGKRRKVREANKLAEKQKAHDEAVRAEKKARKARPVSARGHSGCDCKINSALSFHIPAQQIPKAVMGLHESLLSMREPGGIIVYEEKRDALLMSR